MASKFRTRFFYLVVSFSMTVVSVHADNGSVRPEQFTIRNFIKQAALHPKDNAINLNTLVSNVSVQPVNRICVCEIMDLMNSNENLAQVAVFAEKVNSGNIGTNYQLAERSIKKEKKRMKQVYFDSIRTNTKLAVNTNCKSLYTKLKKTNPDLKLYEIINADVY